MSTDIKALFAEHEADRYALHTRHLNEQMVRVLKTIGYRCRLRARQGQYLYDRAGAKYLDLLSGFGVFAIGRNHPRVQTRSDRCSTANCPTSCRWTCRRWPACWPSGCSRACRISTRCSSPIREPKPSKPRSSSRAPATGRSGIVHCEPRLSRPDLRRAVAERRHDFQEGFRAASWATAWRCRSTI